MITYILQGNLFVILLTLIFMTKSVLCSTIQDAKSLNKVLLRDYDRNVRPTYNQDEPTVVQVSFSLLSLNKYDIKEGVFTIIGVFYFRWTDESMEWNISDYNGITQTRFPQQDVWYPFIKPTYADSEIVPLGAEETFGNNPVTFLHNGTATWNTGNVYRTICQPNMRYFPSDVHNCDLLFSPGYESSSELLLRLFNSDIDKSRFRQNGLWELLQANVTINELPNEPNASKQSLNLKFNFVRLSNFYFVNLLFPIFVIETLVFLVFIIPADSGERISFSVTILLSLSVYMTIVSDKLPEVSEPELSQLSFFLLCAIIFSALTTMATIISLRFHHKKDDEEIHKCYKYFARAYLYCSCQCRRKSVPNRKQFSNGKTDERENSEMNTISDEEDPITWSDVAEWFDCMSFIITFLLYTVKNLIMLFFFRGVIEDFQNTIL